MSTVSGYPPFANHIPQVDAAPVARLRNSGAIILGKTNLPTLANGIQTNSPVFGRTNNPWDLARTPGGSSGAAAAAVSAGLSYLEAQPARPLSEFKSVNWSAPFLPAQVKQPYSVGFTRASGFVAQRRFTTCLKNARS